MFFIALDRINVVKSIKGSFEEAVIAYLFLLNILPILIIPMMWMETGKFCEVLNNWTEFEVSPNHKPKKKFLFNSLLFLFRFCITKCPVECYR